MLKYMLQIGLQLAFSKLLMPLKIVNNIIKPQKATLSELNAMTHNHLDVQITDRSKYVTLTS